MSCVARFLLTTVLWLLASGNHLHAHSLTYRILHRGKVVGTINATRSYSGQQIIYEVISEMAIRIVMMQDISWRMNVVYQNGILLHSHAFCVANEKVQQDCKTTKTKDGYRIIRNRQEESLGQPIFYSGVLLYFKEPSETSYVYSELNGLVNTVKRLGPGHYQLTDRKTNKQNQYWYRNGILHRAELHHTLIELTIERSE